MVEKAKKTKKQRKHGRNSVYCKVYAITHRREKNKIRRLKKHLIHHPLDKTANESLDACKRIVTGG